MYPNIGAFPSNDFYPRPPRGGRLINVHVTVIHNRISIHALREEGDRRTTAVCLLKASFLSTPSARRATAIELKFGTNVTKFLSTPSARRATTSSRSGCLGYLKFLSTPSARRATRPLRLHPPHTPISIHALREEGDRKGPAPACSFSYFYPRPPRGGRRGAS